MKSVLVQRSVRLFRSILLALSLLATPSYAQEELAGSKPNIVMILADDLGWRDVGFAGAKYYETPGIDALAREGLILSRAYSAGANCAPTRASLLTGTSPARHGIYTPGGKAKGEPSYMRLLVPTVGQSHALEARARESVDVVTSLGRDVVTIPKLLASAGYVSARIGKWHLGEEPLGFDFSTDDGMEEARFGRHGTHLKGVDVTRALTDRALQFIEEQGDTPFFLYLSHWDVHVPLDARPDELETWSAKQASLPEDERENLVPAYAAAVTRLDDSVARVVRKIDDVGLAERTLIVFTSDNGGIRKASELEPLRGVKGSLFEAGIRVPACLRWQGVIQSGTTDEFAVNTVDFLPTFAELAGVDLPVEQPIDGQSLVPLIAGDVMPERSLFWHFPLYLPGKGLSFDVPGGERYSWRAVPSTSVLRGKWKAIEYLEDRSLQLFDLAQDPGEGTDVSARHPEVADELRHAIHDWRRATGAPVPAEANPACVLPMPGASVGEGQAVDAR